MATDDSFQDAAERAESASQTKWEQLTISERCAAIYQELRKLDCEATRKKPVPAE
jgi:hypothetical protein